MTKIYSRIANQEKSIFILPNLPYASKDLEPFYSEKLINLHHGKHHQTYVTNLNNLVKDTEFADKSLEEIMVLSANDKSKIALFNNAAQIWNHTFFWHCMKKNGGGVATGKILDQINLDFGNFENFKQEFSQKALTVFGSGWCWLVMNQDRKLSIVQSSNAGNPLVDGLKPLLTIDVWEHAYYPDYENRRAEFITKFFDNLVNWDFVNSIFNE